LREFSVNPLCYISDNASNCVLANTLLADWGDANELASAHDGDLADDVPDIEGDLIQFDSLREDALNQLLEANEVSP
jgi:hypothetical protein